MCHLSRSLFRFKWIENTKTHQTLPNSISVRSLPQYTMKMYEASLELWAHRSCLTMLDEVSMHATRLNDSWGLCSIRLRACSAFVQEKGLKRPRKAKHAKRYVGIQHQEYDNVTTDDNGIAKRVAEASAMRTLKILQQHRAAAVTWHNQKCTKHKTRNGQRGIHG